MQAGIPASATVALVVSVSERPCLHSIRGALGSEIVIGNELFKDAGLGDWLGFYDRLRTTSGDVIGVRLWVDQASEQVRAVGKCVGVVTGESGSPLLIYFSEARECEEAMSDDQDFGSNMLLRSSDRFALTFSSSGLREGNMRAGPLRQRPALPPAAREP